MAAEKSVQRFREPYARGGGLNERAVAFLQRSGLALHILLSFTMVKALLNHHAATVVYILYFVGCEIIDS